METEVVVGECYRVAVTLARAQGSRKIGPRATADNPVDHGDEPIDGAPQRITVSTAQPDF
jgi:hypothetical protein